MYKTFTGLQSRQYKLNSAAEIGIQCQARLAARCSAKMEFTTLFLLLKEVKRLRANTKEKESKKPLQFTTNNHVF